MPGVISFLNRRLPRRDPALLVSRNKNWSRSCAEEGIEWANRPRAERLAPAQVRPNGGSEAYPELFS